MKRNTYIILCVIALGFLAYTGYYAVTHKTIPNTQATASSTPLVATTTETVLEDKSLYTTKSGKKIRLVETNPTGESLSTIIITTEGFATNTSLLLETNKMTNSLYVDLNNDSYEELVITTTAQGSGSFGEVFIFTTASNTALLPVTIPEMDEEDTKKGALFEGYMGHDSFSVVGNNLIREFPTYKKEDTNDEPTGPRRNITYSLKEEKGVYSITLIKGTSTPLIPQMIGTSTIIR